MPETVVILGASAKPARYAYRAQLALLEHGHTPLPVNPRYDHIDGLRCYPDLNSLPGNIDTVTVYVNPRILRTMSEDIVLVRPARVIFNPGSECREIEDRLESAGITVQLACTLVLLDNARF